MYPRVSSMFSPHDVSLPSLCIVKMFVSFMYLCTYDHAGQMDYSTIKEKGAKNVIAIMMVNLYAY